MSEGANTYAITPFTLQIVNNCAKTHMRGVYSNELLSVTECGKRSRGANTYATHRNIIASESYVNARWTLSVLQLYFK